MVDDHHAPSLGLSASALVTFLWGPETTDLWAIKLAVFELVVRRDLEVSWIPRPRRLRSPELIAAVGLGNSKPGYRPPPLQVVLDTRADLQRLELIPLRELIQEVLRRQFVRRGRVFKRWMPSGPRFVDKYVIPELQGAGFVRSITSGQLWSPGIQWDITEEGEESLVRLRAVLAFAGAGYEEFAASNPQEAIGFTNEQGSALLLIRSLVPTYRLLVGKQLGNLPRRTIRPASDHTGHAPRLPPVDLHMLAGAFGPEGRYDVDTLFHLISGEVDASWRAMQGAMVLGFHGE
jgi:hypothetical protein